MGATAKAEHDAVRQSTVSRERADKTSLLRLVLDPDGFPFVDVLGRAPGRGVYVAPQELEQALSSKGLARAFRGKAKGLAPAEVNALVEATRSRLEERLVEMVGLARRAGQLALGMDATLSRLASSAQGTVVLTAIDFSERSTQRIQEAISKTEGASWIRASTTERLGRALGRETVGVVAVWHPSLARALLQEHGRISGLSRMAGERSAQEQKD